MNISEKIKSVLKEVLIEVLENPFAYENPLNVLETRGIHLEHPNNLSHGDFSTNLAMVYFSKERSESKKRIEKDRGDQIKKESFIYGGSSSGEYSVNNPRGFAELIKEKLLEKKLPEIAENGVSVAGPGFINIQLSQKVFTDAVKEVLEKGKEYGNNELWQGKKILVEHSSPNLFKPFHIGHMMNNTVGEAITRLCRTSGAMVTAISYPSDVSLGIGKTVWQLLEYGVSSIGTYKTLAEKITFLGKCYADGTNAMKENPELEKRMREITQDIYEHNDTEAYQAYCLGRDLNLEYFRNMTTRLGSQFDDYIFESQAGKIGKKLIIENTPAIFTESDGAIVFEPTESDLEKDKSLHTRVFINKDGNPTYEAKDTGLLKLKFDLYKPNLSIFVTDSEQGPYFNVVATAAGKINPDWKEKTIHKTHGRMSFKGEKMSSRLGNTPIVSDILDLVNEEVYERAGERNLAESQADMISIAALKYTILRTQAGKAINFDPETSLSFEGDSGPYLQYTYARCQSILRNASESDLHVISDAPENWKTLDLEKYIYRFPELVALSFKDLAPHYVVTYITEIAQLFNSWYGQGKIIDADNPETGYRLALVSATAQIIKNGLWILGIEAPDKM